MSLGSWSREFKKRVVYFFEREGADSGGSKRFLKSGNTMDSNLSSVREARNGRVRGKKTTLCHADTLFYVVWREALLY